MAMLPDTTSALTGRGSTFGSSAAAAKRKRKKNKVKPVVDTYNTLIITQMTTAGKYKTYDGDTKKFVAANH